MLLCLFVGAAEVSVIVVFSFCGLICQCFVLNWYDNQLWGGKYHLQSYRNVLDIQFSGVPVSVGLDNVAVVGCLISSLDSSVERIDCNELIISLM